MKWQEEISDPSIIQSIIFMVSLSDYCVSSKTKGKSNKLIESLDVYKAIASDPTLNEIPIVILFNKVNQI